jgi:hypothetical protein
MGTPCFDLAGPVPRYLLCRSAQCPTRGQVKPQPDSATAVPPLAPCNQPRSSTESPPGQWPAAGKTGARAGSGRRVEPTSANLSRQLQSCGQLTSTSRSIDASQHTPWSSGATASRDGLFEFEFAQHPHSAMLSRAARPALRAAGAAASSRYVTSSQLGHFSSFHGAPGGGAVGRDGCVGGLRSSWEASKQNTPERTEQDDAEMETET